MEEKQYTDENTIIELSSVTEDTLFDEDVVESKVEITENEMKVKKVKKKSSKPKKEFFWKRLEKKHKIIIIICICLVLLAVVGVLLYFFVFKKDDETPKKPIENVVIEKDNYIYDNGKLKLLDKNDKVIGIYTCVDTDVEKCYVAPVTTEDEFDMPKYIDEDDNVIEQKSKIYNDRFVFIYDDKKIVLYDIDSETKTGDYKLIKTGLVDEDIVVVQDSEDNYGIIKFSLTDANVLIDFEYEYLGIAKDSELFVAKEGNYSYLVDDSGEAVTSKVRGNIRSFTNKYLAVYDDEYALYNYQGQNVLTDTYDYIDFSEDYIFVISNKKLVAYDNELNKLNEAAIKLKNEYYNKIYVFDKENNLKETKKAYTVSFTNDAIKFELSDETTKEINLNEIAINKSLSYVNYLDGKLYFYSDSEKKDLIGSYDCSNKNVVTSSSDIYSNCMVAKDSNIINDNQTLGYIPIINENYVFIKDTKTGAANENIVLYDIKNSSQKVKYQAVDTGISSEDINHISSINGLIAAKNTDGNVGIITFGANGPSGLISFKDSANGGATKKISYLKDYILVERVDANYLYEKNGDGPIASSKFAIKDYRNGYILVKDNKYLVYEMENASSGKIISEELDHVELFDNFFVGIKDKKLNVYNYKDGKTKLLVEDLEIVNSDVAKGYKLAIYSDSYVVSIYTQNNASIDYKYNLTDWSKVE